MNTGDGLETCAKHLRRPRIGLRRREAPEAAAYETQGALKRQWRRVRDREAGPGERSTASPRPEPRRPVSICTAGRHIPAARIAIIESATHSPWTRTGLISSLDLISTGARKSASPRTGSRP